MSYFAFASAKDLKADALFLAGEPQDGSSQFDTLAYPFLSTVQNCLVSGGVFGPEPLIPVSWLWARKYPRGTIQMVLPYNGLLTNTATFTQGSTTVTMTTPFAASDPNVINWRVWLQITPSGTAPMRPYIRAITSPTTFELKDPWTDTTITTTQWMAFQAEYDLPRDFVRFASPIFVSGWPYRIDVIEPYQLEQSYPFSLIGPAVPVLAAVVGQNFPGPVSDGIGGVDTVQKVRFSHFLGTTAQGSGANTPLQLEFEYIFRPEPLQEGNIPAVPLEHRRIISFGGAYLILEDKADNERDRMWARFRTAYRAMVNEYRQSMKNASSRWGVPIPRFIDEPRRLRTESGLIVW